MTYYHCFILFLQSFDCVYNGGLENEMFVNIRTTYLRRPPPPPNYQLVIPLMENTHYCSEQSSGMSNSLSKAFGTSSQWTFANSSEPAIKVELEILILLVPLFYGKVEILWHFKNKYSSCNRSKVNFRVLWLINRPQLMLHVYMTDFR